ncbi:SAM domain-containing protein [Caenorhabditis elegans]|uniref:SAM domain-containing protein n=1 Tax=Caenorhabditis elegans TaxID=6239 RepID=Q9XVV7_CAEEL|nr:SAM domain-containing protein [Caenorhabditis elegans]CAA94214.1 SAM domain-containing protein [Caenorhabditis elegans]|eukprot:NP_510372.1 Uncharacterized protein CELE_K04C1.2 [Caenorhabditis elegans]
MSESRRPPLPAKITVSRDDMRRFVPALDNFGKPIFATFVSKGTGNPGSSDQPSTSSAGNVHRNSTINQGANDGSERNTRAVTARQSAGRIESAPVEVANPATQSAIVQVLTTGEASQLHEKILESPKDKWYYYLDQTRANQIVEVDTRLPRTEGKCPDQKDKKLDEQARIERNVAGILKNAALEISNRNDDPQNSTPKCSDTKKNTKISPKKSASPINQPNKPDADDIKMGDDVAKLPSPPNLSNKRKAAPLKFGNEKVKAAKLFDSVPPVQKCSKNSVEATSPGMESQDVNESRRLVAKVLPDHEGSSSQDLSDDGYSSPESSSMQLGRNSMTSNEETSHPVQQEMNKTDMVIADVISQNRVHQPSQGPLHQEADAPEANRRQPRQSAESRRRVPANPEYMTPEASEMQQPVQPVRPTLLAFEHESARVYIPENCDMNYELWDCQDVANWAAMFIINNPYKTVDPLIKDAIDGSMMRDFLTDKDLRAILNIPFGHYHKVKYNAAKLINHVAEIRYNNAMNVYERAMAVWNARR